MLLHFDWNSTLPVGKIRNTGKPCGILKWKCSQNGEGRREGERNQWKPQTTVNTNGWRRRKEERVERRSHSIQLNKTKLRAMIHWNIKAHKRGKYKACCISKNLDWTIEFFEQHNVLSIQGVQSNWSQFDLCVRNIYLLCLVLCKGRSTWSAFCGRHELAQHHLDSILKQSVQHTQRSTFPKCCRRTTSSWSKSLRARKVSQSFQGF